MPSSGHSKCPMKMIFPYHSDGFKVDQNQNHTLEKCQGLVFGAVALINEFGKDDANEKQVILQRFQGDFRCIVRNSEFSRERERERERERGFSLQLVHFLFQKSKRDHKCYHMSKFHLNSSIISALNTRLLVDILYTNVK